MDIEKIQHEITQRTLEISASTPISADASSAEMLAPSAQAWEEVTRSWTEAEWAEFNAGITEQQEQRRQAAESKLPFTQEQLTAEQARDIYTFMFRVLHNSEEDRLRLSFGGYEAIMGLLAVMRSAYPEHLKEGEFAAFDPHAHYQGMAN